MSKMKEIKLVKGQIVDFELGIEKCSVIVEGKYYSEKISCMTVVSAIDIKVNSFVREVYMRCIGIAPDQYKMCIDYNFIAS